uniref:2'-phosphotransferase n=1 Tax=Ciona savignyi TaxID=51511 RepID=H2ZMM8_CIOSA
FGKREVQEDGFYPVLKVATLCKEKPKQKCLKHSAASAGPSKRNPEQESREDLEGSLEESPFSAEIKGKESERKKRNRDVIIGKSLSAVLRHNKFGFKVDDEGYVEVDAILKHQHFRKLWVTREELYRLVDANDKQRFAIHVNKDGRELIKANQGHSVEVAALKLTPITEARDYPHVIHGTFWKSWSFIAKEGLSRRKRVHIHMTTAEPNSDKQVVSGMRYSCDVFVHVDMESALKDGIQFFLSENKVILSPGDEHGYILPKHFLKVEGISKGKRITLLDNTIKETTANDVTDSLPADVEADFQNESNESNPSIPQ